MHSLDSPRHADFIYPEMAFEDDLFLLDRDAKIIGGRFALSPSPVNQDIYTLYQIPPEEQKALREHTHSFDKRPMLLIGQSPVLIFDYLLPMTGRMLALVPTAPDLVRLFLAPGRYADSLSDDLVFSPLACVRLQAQNEKNYQHAVRWLHTYLQPLTFKGADGNDPDILRLALTLRVRRLAQLSGCAVCYDFGSFGFGQAPPPETEAQSVLFFSLFLLTRRAATDRGVGLYLCRSDDIPVVHALLRLYDAEDRLPEFEGLEQIFKERGMVFHAARLPTDRALLHVRFSVCRPNIRAQELRNAFPSFESGNDLFGKKSDALGNDSDEERAAASFLLSCFPKETNH